MTERYFTSQEVLQILGGRVQPTTLRNWNNRNGGYFTSEIRAGAGRAPSLYSYGAVHEAALIEAFGAIEANLAHVKGYIGHLVHNHISGRPCPFAVAWAIDWDVKMNLWEPREFDDDAILKDIKFKLENHNSPAGEEYDPPVHVDRTKIIYVRDIISFTDEMIGRLLQEKT